MNKNITFEKAVIYVQLGLAKVQFPDSPELSNDYKLKFYGLYKMVTVGPNKTTYPGFFDFTGKAKWEAWNKLSDLDKNEAMKQYIELLDKVAPKWEKFLDSYKN